ncbi:MAG: enoyl-CoA hydratase [Chloroflexi bacterium]|nr:enoyl-CoA hydratase [Chloroflexota bacterium]MYD17209.1 enoyl-CoA hydratase [Chloroflexota bacterium]
MSDTNSDSTVIFEKRDDGVGLITLNRPERMNAFGDDLLQRLSEALVECEDDPEIRCVALTGAGRGFSAGADINNMGRRGDAPPPGPGVVNRRSHRSQMETSGMLREMGTPTVSLVNGPAAGGGLGLCLATDFRIASERARFVTAFRNIGVSGDYGVAWFLTHMVGNTRARELLMLDRRLNADEAEALGIVNRVVPHDELMSEGLTFCRELAQGPTAVLSMMKWTLNYAATSSLSDSLYQEGSHVMLSFTGEDNKEAARAFLEKRPPNFIGR